MDSYTVIVKHLDHVLFKNIECIELVKIDIKGAELLRFRGTRDDTIKRFKLPILLGLNKKAAASFDYDTLDAAKTVLSYNPKCRLIFADAHAST